MEYVASEERADGIGILASTGGELTLSKAARLTTGEKSPGMIAAYRRRPV
jgi:hypothetical protein